PSHPQSMLNTSLLLQMGLLELHRIVVGTRYEAIFKKACRSATRGQLVDIHSGDSGVSMNEIKNSAEAKNHLLLACAAALAAAARDEGDNIISFARSGLLAFQYLDDIYDWPSDIKRKHRTVLLDRLAVSTGMDRLQLADLSNRAVLQHLVA